MSRNPDQLFRDIRRLRLDAGRVLPHGIQREVA
jgi:hypothetical protein